MLHVCVYTQKTVPCFFYPAHDCASDGKTYNSEALHNDSVVSLWTASNQAKQQCVLNKHKGSCGLNFRKRIVTWES